MIQFDPHNYRKHNDRNQKLIKKSLKDCGAGRSILIDANNDIIAGNGVYEQAEKLNIPVKIIETNGSELVVVKRTDIQSDDERRKQLAIMDNSTSDSSEFDFDKLSADFGFSDLESFGISSVDFGFGSPEEVVQDEIPEIDGDVISNLGDVWQLGEHRLMCGDSTKIEDVNILMNGESADLVVTDPPYNMGYCGAGNTSKHDRELKKIANDKMTEEDFSVFLLAIYKNINALLKQGGGFYVFYKELGSAVFLTKLREAGLTFKQELIWHKNQIVIGGAKYQNMYEPCLFGCKGNNFAYWFGGRKQKSVIETIALMNEDELRVFVAELCDSFETDVIKEAKPLKNDLHPTMKPIKLLAKFISNSSAPGAIVADLFGGSGSTMIAAEQLGRKCYMMEYVPRLCDVIIKRWENFTGKKAMRTNER